METLESRDEEDLRGALRDVYERARADLEPETRTLVDRFAHLRLARLCVLAARTKDFCRP